MVFYLFTEAVKESTLVVISQRLFIYLHGKLKRFGTFQNVNVLFSRANTSVSFSHPFPRVIC